jgi:hypothetical protein
MSLIFLPTTVCLRKDDIVELFGFAGEFWQRLKEKEPRAVFRFLVLERMLSKAARIFFT